MKKLLACVAVSAVAATPLALAAPAEAEPTYTVTGGQVVTYDADARRGTTDIDVTCVADVSTTAAVTVEVTQADAGGPGEPARSFQVLGDIPCDPTPVVQSIPLIIEPDPTSRGFVEGPADLGVGFTPAGAESPETFLVSTQISVPPASTPDPPTPDPTPTPVATRPSGPRSAQTTVSSHRVVLHWRAPSSDGGATVNRYQVQRGTAKSTRRNVRSTASAAAFTGLTNRHRYAFYVRAHNRVGYSRWARAYGTPKAPPTPRAYRSCADMNAGMYPHGVGRVSAVDHTSGIPVTNFTHNTAAYHMNDGRVSTLGQYDLDRDNDGIACEKR